MTKKNIVLSSYVGKVLKGLIAEKERATKEYNEIENTTEKKNKAYFIKLAYAKFSKIRLEQAVLSLSDLQLGDLEIEK